MKIQQALAISLDMYSFTGYVASNKKRNISMKYVVGAEKADASCVEMMMWDFGKPHWEQKGCQCQLSICASFHDQLLAKYEFL
jgi:hypothetical protein